MRNQAISALDIILRVDAAVCVGPPRWRLIRRPCAEHPRSPPRPFPTLPSFPCPHPFQTFCAVTVLRPFACQGVLEELER